MPVDNNLDDLFRQQLGPHATPPGADLQRRLAELAAAERLDAQFRAGLGGHASRPRRALWERLEDEHLHPPVRRRRVAAWWQYSAAAVLLLLLLAGGAGLWRGYLGQDRAGGVAAGKPAGGTAPKRQGGVGSPALTAAGQRASRPQPETPVTEPQVLAHNPTSLSKKNQKKMATRATAPALSPSSPSIAIATRPRRPAPARRPASQPGNPQRPDAAAGELATTHQRKAPAGRPEPATSQPTVAAATPTLAAAPAPMGLVEVEVRRGPEAARPAPAPAATVAAAEPRPERRSRLRLGGLLRQADRLAHGEAVSLADATGPAESLTVQARIGGRLLSKTIRL